VEILSSIFVERFTIPAGLYPMIGGGLGILAVMLRSALTLSTKGTLA